jgi:hypothetical protein
VTSKKNDGIERERERGGERERERERERGKDRNYALSTELYSLQEKETGAGEVRRSKSGESGVRLC